MVAWRCQNEVSEDTSICLETNTSSSLRWLDGFQRDSLKHSNHGRPSSVAPKEYVDYRSLPNSVSVKQLHILATDNISRQCRGDISVPN